MARIASIIELVRVALGNFKELGVLVPLLAFVLFVGITHPVFFSTGNLVSMIREAAFIAIIAFGMTFVLVGAGIDISVGSVLGLSGVITGFCLVGGVPILPSVAIGTLVGLVSGLITGSAVVAFRIPSLIASLGMLYAVRGVSLVLSGGQPIVGFPPEFSFLGSGKVFGFPVPIIIFLIFAVVFHFVLNHTKYGYWIKAMGGNRESARLSGLPIQRLELSIFALSGTMAGFAGVLVLSRLSAAYTQTGRTWELLVIAAVIIGGTSLFGGSGTIIGTIIGALIIRVINTSLVILGVNANWQEIAIGSIIVAAVAFDSYQRRRQKRMQARRAISTGEEKGQESLDVDSLFGEKGRRTVHSDRTIAMEMREVSKYYGFVRALENVNFRLYEGEVLALVGDNGAGKSTLIKLASGAHAPDHGTVEVFGETVHLDSPRDAMAQGISTVYQDLALVDTLDVAANLYLGREPSRGWKIDRARMLREGGELLRALRIDIPSPKVALGNLSGGQRQIIAIAKAISQGGRIIILDEPTAAIGVEQQAKVLELIEALRDQGLSVVMISHNLSHVFSVADRIMVLRGGKNVGTLDAHETTTNQVVSLITGTVSLPEQAAPNLPK